MSTKRILSLVVLVTVSACSAQRSTPPLATPSAGPIAATPSPPAATQVAIATATAAPTPAEPVTFTSLLYGYSVTLPPGWHTGVAMLRWDGKSAPGHDDGSVDKLVGPASAMVFAHAAPMTVDLDRFVQDTITWTVRDHGDTCPATKPETTEPIQIGGEPGMLLSWNCGILINEALTIRDKTGYVFVLRDTAVPAATDPADLALLRQLLDSVSFAP